MPAQDRLPRRLFDPYLLMKHSHDRLPLLWVTRRQDIRQPAECPDERVDRVAARALACRAPKSPPSPDYFAGNFAKLNGTREMTS